MQWNDTNGNGVADNGEIMVIPGASALPSQNFPRFAVGGDLRIGFTIPNLGATMLYGEIVWAKNMDRARAAGGSGRLRARLPRFGAYGALIQESDRT